MTTLLKFPKSTLKESNVLIESIDALESTLRLTESSCYGSDAKARMKIMRKPKDCNTIVTDYEHVKQAIDGCIVRAEELLEVCNKRKALGGSIKRIRGIMDDFKDLKVWIDDACAEYESIAKHAMRENKQKKIILGILVFFIVVGLIYSYLNHWGQT